MGDQPKIAAKDVRPGMRVKFPASEFMLYDGVHEVDEQPEPEEDGMVSIPGVLAGMAVRRRAGARRHRVRTDRRNT